MSDDSRVIIAFECRKTSGAGISDVYRGMMGRGGISDISGRTGGGEIDNVIRDTVGGRINGLVTSGGQAIISGI